MSLFRPRLLCLLALLGLVAGAGPAPAQVAAGYAVTDLGALAGPAGTSQAFGVSPNGQFVTGLTQVGGGTFHAFRYAVATGTMTDLGTLPGLAHSIGVAVNDSGAVVGRSSNAPTASVSFDWSDRAFIATGATSAAIPLPSGNGPGRRPFAA